MKNNFNLGTFEGFNFKTNSAICGMLSASDVIHWDHDRKGEAEFWPAGDRPELLLILEREATGSTLSELTRILSEVGDDSPETLLRIYYAVRTLGMKLEAVSESALADLDLQIFRGNCFSDVRKEAAYQLFELYHPEEYAIWEKSQCDGLIFDCDRFLDSPSFYVDEIRLKEEAVLLVASN